MTLDLDVDMIAGSMSSSADMSVNEPLDMQRDEEPEPSNLAGDWVWHHSYLVIRYRSIEPLYVVMGVDVKISAQNGAQIEQYRDVRTHVQRSHEGDTPSMAHHPVARP